MDMGERFGQDFSMVRVHHDAQAAESARLVNARAYAVGRHVVFGAGEYMPQTDYGRRLLAHELAHVVQQGAGAFQQRHLQIGRPNDHLEREADDIASRIAASDRPPRARGATHGLALQRDLATPAPAAPAPPQRELTPDDIRRAIAFNRARYDEANTRLIQDLLGGPVTGRWTEENIVAIANTQEEYGLRKDGMVGFETFRFLNQEARREKLPTSTEKCLTAFEVIGPDAPTFRRVDATHCRVEGHFQTRSQFSARCNCHDFEYRQFIRGHKNRDRGGVVTDLSGEFADLPAGRLTPDFREDGDVTDAVAVNYGHRADPDEANPLNRYINDRLATDQANGCRYRSEDTPHSTLADCRAGDILDVDVNFRGEIQRRGRPIERKFWTAFRGRFAAPP
jgi:hypothetical protein